MLYSELKNKMRDFNNKYRVERKVCERHKEDGTLVEMIGRVVIKNSKLIHDFPIEQRTYEFNNYNKALTDNDLGYSIFAYCKADNDCIRIEYYNDEDIESAEIIKIVE